MLSSILEDKPDGAAAVIVPDGPAVTYGELRSCVDRAAGLLTGAGLEPDRPVSIALGNSLEFLIAFLAVARAGAIAAPLNPAYTAEEFAFYVADAGSQMAVVPPGAHPARDAADSLGVPTLEVSLAGGDLAIPAPVTC